MSGKVAQGKLVTQFVKPKDQLTDIHTKEQGKDMFKFFRAKLGVMSSPPTSLRVSVKIILMIKIMITSDKYSA